MLKLKQVEAVGKRLDYLHIMKGESLKSYADLNLEIAELKSKIFDYSDVEFSGKISKLEEIIFALEQNAAKTISPYDIVRLSRSPQRIRLSDILMNVFDSYQEFGGVDGFESDPAVIVAKAFVSRKVDDKLFRHPVMVIGHEKGRGAEDYSQAGSATPEGNKKVIEAGMIAAREGIPIYLFGNTPGAMHFEDKAPGASQQISDNLAFLAKVRTPVIVVNYGEGGSGGFEALGLGDYRIMLSHAWYSVISPESAAAIEFKTASPNRDQVEYCAKQLHITSKDNLDFGVVDHIINEPALGARAEDFDFFKLLKYEIIKATDMVVLNSKPKYFRSLRKYQLHQGAFEDTDGSFHLDINWQLTNHEKKRLLRLRSNKYRNLAAEYYQDDRSRWKKFTATLDGIQLSADYYIDNFLRHHYRILKMFEEGRGESLAVWKLLGQKTRSLLKNYGFMSNEKRRRNKLLSAPESIVLFEPNSSYVSPLAKKQLSVTCPNNSSAEHFDLWVPDLYRDNAGVCHHCGYHFPVEYQWYLNHVIDKASIKEFNQDIRAINPVGYEGLDERLEKARKLTGKNSSVMTFEASVQGIGLVVAMCIKDFIGGTIGAAESEKIVRAFDLAKIKKKPMLFYSHFCGGIRIFEGSVGLTAMPKCTMAAAEYMEAGGLYMVVFDHDSYAGPVASFLSCTPYKFGIKSSNIGFAGRKVIQGSTKFSISPDYHSVERALERRQILECWDRRDFRKNLANCCQTMGGSSLYYRK